MLIVEECGGVQIAEAPVGFSVQVLGLEGNQDHNFSANKCEGC